MTNAAFRADVAEFCRRLRRRQVDGATPCARGTAELLRRLIAGGRHPDAASLLADVQQWGVAMQAAHPLELSIGNIVRRVLHMIREEAQEEDGAGGTAALFGGFPVEAGGGRAGSGGGAGAGDAGLGGLGGGPAASASSSGLLSRALRPVAAPGRVVSLHNLLAASPGKDVGGAGTMAPAPPEAARAAVADAGRPARSSDEDGAEEEEEDDDDDDMSTSGTGSASASDDSGDASTSSGGRGRAPPANAAAARRPAADTTAHARPAPPSRRSARGRPPWEGKAGVLDGLNELIDDLAEMDGNIALRAGDYVHANEVVLTLGACPTVLRFLVEAAKKRDFQVVVAEGAAPAAGHAAAAALARAGVSTTLIADSAIFAVASRANKVLLGARALLANGGILAPSGGRLLALAASRHAAPLVALVGMHQLSPLFPHDPALAVNDFGPPAGVLAYSAVAAPVPGGGWCGDAASSAGGGGGGGSAVASPSGRRGGAGSAAGNAATAAAGQHHHHPTGPPPLHVHAPRVDYVPPELIALFVTDTGGYTPSYVYRLLAEYYSRADFSLGEAAALG